MSTTDNLEIQKLLQITNIPALQELKKITNNPAIQQLNQLQNSLTQLNPFFKDINIANNAIRSIIPPELSELQRTISEQFSALPSSKIKELKNEYEDELLSAVGSLSNTVNSSNDIGLTNNEAIKSNYDELKDFINRFTDSSNDKIKSTWGKIIQVLNTSQSPLEIRLFSVIQIILNILMLMK